MFNWTDSIVTDIYVDDTTKNKNQLTYYFTGAKCNACDLPMKQKRGSQRTLCNSCLTNPAFLLEYEGRRTALEAEIGELESSCVDCFTDTFGYCSREEAVFTEPCQNMDCHVNFTLNYKRRNKKKIIKSKSIFTS